MMDPVFVDTNVLVIPTRHHESGEQSRADDWLTCLPRAASPDG